MIDFHVHQPRADAYPPADLVDGMDSVGVTQSVVFTYEGLLRPSAAANDSLARFVGGAPTRLHAFERDLRAGTRLDIRITKRGFIGKRTVILIRRGRVPRRLDTCLAPGSRSRAVACTRALP